MFISLTVVHCVAKLPRLMQAGHPQQIFPEQLANAGENVSGTLTIESMTRLAGLLAGYEGNVDYDLNFSRHEQGWIRIDGRFFSRLSMTCQRCMKPVDVDLEQDVKVAIVSNDDEARNIPGQFEPLMLNEGPMKLKDYLEEEILLALPLAPSHETEDCHRTELTEEQDDTKRENPFKVLKDLKLGK